MTPSPKPPIDARRRFAGPPSPGNRGVVLWLLVLTAACSVIEGAPDAAVTAPPATPAPVTPSAGSAALAPSSPLAPTPAPPSPTPALPVLRQLTDGGCCTGPFWSPDGSQVWFVDRPSEGQPSGIWGVDAAGGEPELVTDRLGIYSPDRSLIAYPDGGGTVVERLGRDRWIVPSEGRPIAFSPDSARIAWQVASSPANFDRRKVVLWVANVDGTESRSVVEVTGGGLQGWFPDGERMLVSGRDPESLAPFLAVLRLADGSLTPIAQGADRTARLRGGSISPEGGWVAYQITFSGDPAVDGLWVVRVDGSDARRLDPFGAYRWRSEGTLAVVPLEPGAPSHRLVEVEADTGDSRSLTDPSLVRFRIEGGDWTMSPDGERVAFVSAEDHNVWVIELP